MFYGLSNFFKNILPKRLFYRALLIVAIPVIVLQLVITIVFFDSLWIKTNKGMTKALVSEVKTFIEVYKDEIYNKDEITNLFSIYQDLNIEYVDNEKFYSIKFDQFDFSEGDLVYTEKDYSFIKSGEGIYYRLFKKKKIYCGKKNASR